MIRDWVMNGQRLPLDNVPCDAPKEIRSQIEACWNQECSKRPSFNGNKIIIVHIIILIGSDCLFFSFVSNIFWYIKRTYFLNGNFAMVECSLFRNLEGREGESW